VLDHRNNHHRKTKPSGKKQMVGWILIHHNNYQSKKTNGRVDFSPPQKQKQKQKTQHKTKNKRI